MRTAIITVAMALVPGPAWAADVMEKAEGFWEEHDVTVLTAGASIANFAGMFPGIGIGMGIGSELPSRSWSVAGTVAGSAQLTLGILSMINGSTQDDQGWLAAYGAATAVLGVSNLILGLVNIVRHDRVIHRLKILDFAVAPMPLEDGGGAAVAIRL